MQQTQQSGKGVKTMTPEEALNNLTQLAYYYADDDEHILNNAKGYYELIETALKRLEEYDKTEYSALIESHKKLLKEKSANEKSLKALEIIKEKKVDVYHIQATNKVGEYNFWRLRTSKRLKKKEYDLLKEVLKDE